MSDFLRVMEDLLSTLWCIFSLLLLPSLLTAAVAAAEADAADAADADDSLQLELYVRLLCALRTRWSPK